MVIGKKRQKPLYLVAWKGHSLSPSLASLCLGLPLGTRELHGRTSLTDDGPTCMCKLSAASQAYPQLCREGPKCHLETAARDRLLLPGAAPWAGEGSLRPPVCQMVGFEERPPFRGVASCSSCVLGSVRMLCFTPSQSPFLPQATSPVPQAQIVSVSGQFEVGLAGKGGLWAALLGFSWLVKRPKRCASKI